MIEWHTGDLTHDCPHAVLLRRLGYGSKEFPTAMARGLIAGEALRYCHEQDEWTDAAAAPAVKYGVTSVLQEGELTEGAEKALPEIERDVTGVVLEYCRRLGPLFKRCMLIGCELPVRWEFDHDGLHQPQAIASHLDLLVRDRANVFGRGENRLLVMDWKYRKSVSFAYLKRDMQLRTYACCVQWGKVELASGLWHGLQEWPAVAWIHLPALHRYKRKTIKDGGETVYKKGDCRPLEDVVRWLPFEPSEESRFLDELSDRLSMGLQGYWPRNPGTERCHVCDVEGDCAYERRRHSDIARAFGGGAAGQGGTVDAHDRGESAHRAGDAEVP